MKPNLLKALRQVALRAAHAELSGRPVFDIDTLHQVAKRSVGLPHIEMCRAVVDGLHQAYPGEIVDDAEWCFSCAGGAVGVMKLLYGSFSEFLHIYGTPIGTEGFSGRYRIDIHDFVLSGEMWTYSLDRVGESIVTSPGERARLIPGQVKGYRLPAGCWMLEYGRGPIPTALPFGLADALFSMADARTIWQTLATYSRISLRNAGRGRL